MCSNPDDTRCDVIRPGLALLKEEVDAAVRPAVPRGAPAELWADVATKDDLRMLGLELRGEITELRTELRDEIAGLRLDIADGQRRLTLTLVGAMVWISGITFAANAVF